MNSATAIKDALVGKTAQELQLPEDVVDRVVMNQFKQAHHACRTYNEIEISGFGKFLQSQTKLIRRAESSQRIKAFIERNLQEASTQEEVIKWTKRLDHITESLDYYQSRIKPKDETTGHHYRVAQSSDSP